MGVLVGQREEAEAARRRRRLAGDHQPGDADPGAVGEVADGGQRAASQRGELVADEGEQVAPVLTSLSAYSVSTRVRSSISGSGGGVAGHLEQRRQRVGVEPARGRGLVPEAVAGERAAATRGTPGEAAGRRRGAAAAGGGARRQALLHLLQLPEQLAAVAPLSTSSKAPASTRFSMARRGSRVCRQKSRSEVAPASAASSHAMRAVGPSAFM